MHPILKGILAFIAGVVVGNIVNLSLIYLGMEVIPLPEGTSIIDLKSAIPLFETKHFISPFVAHAAGTFLGAFTTAKISKNFWLTMSMGAFFLVGGIVMVLDVGGPTWFILLDLIGAYLPMAYLAFRITK